jgi:uncharacterized protein (TIGR03083 family)
MSSLADRTIAALRTTHDSLAPLVPGLSAEQLTGPSGASEWTIAQVLSHLGSGAEIALAGYRAALTGEPAPGQGFNPSVWARWDAMTPQEQADGFLEHDEVVVRTLEELAPEQRETTTVELGFLPEPLPLAGAVGMRLHEAAQHAWDVRVGLDPQAGVDPEAAEVLVEHFSGDLGMMVGFFGKPDRLSSPARVAVGDDGLVLVIDDGVRLSRGGETPTARFDGPLEALVRLLGGRLKDPYVPQGLTVTGSVTLADLQRVFPGF